MDNADDFFASINLDEEDQVLWPEDSKERERYAEGLFGSAVVQGVASVADAMLSRVDGRWPKPGSMDYEEEIKVAEIFRAMSPEQRAAVQELVSETARLVGYSVFLGMEHFGSGNVQVQILPINRGKPAGEAVSVNAGEWHQAYLSWEERFK
jgi:hypothetical protein